MMTDPSHKGESVSIFSPADQHRSSIRKLSKGAHHMVLIPKTNAAYEDEVACFIDGAPVGIMHDEQSYYYHSQLTVLKKHQIEMVTPCQVTENDVVYFRPLPNKHLKEWVDGRIGASSDDALKPAGTTIDDREPLLRLSGEQATRVSARIGRHLVNLASREWFNSQDAPTMARFAYALYGYDSSGVAEQLSPKQEEELVLSAYALHRAAPELLDYDRSVIIGTDDYAQSVSARAVMIRDPHAARAVIDRSSEAQSVVQEMVGGKKFAEEADDPEDTVLPPPAAFVGAVATKVVTTRIEVAQRREVILSHVAEGRKINDIAVLMSIPESTIRNDLRLLNIDSSYVSRKGDKNGSREAAALALHQQGKTTEEVAEILHLTYAQAWHALRSVG